MEITLILNNVKAVIKMPLKGKVTLTNFCEDEMEVLFNINI